MADFDAEWCRVQSLAGYVAGIRCVHTAADKARIAQCERWLQGLATTAFGDQTAAVPAPVQLDLLDLLTTA
jgi:hypothetical protein